DHTSLVLNSQLVESLLLSHIRVPIVDLGSSMFLVRPHPGSTLFPYTTLFRSEALLPTRRRPRPTVPRLSGEAAAAARATARQIRSEEHTSELQSRENLVCRLLLEKKKNCCKTWIRESTIIPHPPHICRPTTPS